MSVAKETEGEKLESSSKTSHPQQIKNREPRAAHQSKLLSNLGQNNRDVKKKTKQKVEHAKLRSRAMKRMKSINLLRDDTDDH